MVSDGVWGITAGLKPLAEGSKDVALLAEISIPWIDAQVHTKRRPSAGAKPAIPSWQLGLSVPRT